MATTFGHPFSAPSSTVGPAFSTSRIIRFGDLADEEKEAFAKFFAESTVAFFKDSDGSYVANVRLFDPAVINVPSSKVGSKAAEENRHRKEDRYMSSMVAQLGGSATALDFSVYPRFTSSISPRDTVRPKARPLAWVMRHIEEIYDNRYAKDTADLRGDESVADGDNTVVPFPTFVVEFFSKRYGLRNLIDQTCWDLLYNVHTFRKQYLEVEIFARFLEEYYDPDDLLFYLYVRSVIQKELNLSFRSRWTEMGRIQVTAGSSQVSPTDTPKLASGPPPIFLTLRECQIVSRVVFGSEADPLYRTFISMIEQHLEGGPKSKASDRRIDVTKFLHLALVEYHETRPAEDSDLSGQALTGNPNATDRLIKEAEAQYDDRIRALQSSSDTPPSATGGELRPSHALLEELGDRMHRSNEAYLDRLMTSASALPADVRLQIRTEAQKQLENRVDGILTRVISSAQSEAAASRDPLAAHFVRIVKQESASGAGVDHDAIGGFCAAMLEHEDIKRSINQLVQLLVQYATSRLQESGTPAA